MFVYNLVRTPVVSRLSIHATNMSKWNKHFSRWTILVMNYCYLFIYCSKLCIHIYCYLLSLDILLVLDMGGVLMAVEPVEDDMWYLCWNQDSTFWSCQKDIIVSLVWNHVVVASDDIWSRSKVQSTYLKPSILL